MGGVTRYDGERFVTFTAADGLAGDKVICLLQARNDHLWFGFDTGVTRYDGETFQTFTALDGLAAGGASSIMEDRRGVLWFGLGWYPYDPGFKGGEKKGVAQYDGEVFRVLTDRNSPVDHVVYSMLQDHLGNLWFGGEDRVTRYDGKRSETFTIRDGLVAGPIVTIGEDRDGRLWFGSGLHGVSRFDGKEWRSSPADSADLRFTTFTTENGLPDNQLRDIVEDEEGYVWVGTHAGLSRYEGAHWATFTSREGLPSPYVFSVLQDRTGTIWFGTRGGLVRYDDDGLERPSSRTGWPEARYETFTVADGLKPGIVTAILTDRRGHLWFGIHGAGIVRYDGLVFQDLHQRDGLVSDTVQDILQDRDGDFWITTDGGVTRYTPSAMPPAVRLKEVIADRSYGAVGELVLSSSQRLIQFSFQGRSFSTPPERMVYVYRLQGYEEEWRPTHQTSVRYTDLPEGHYVFQVKAVDRDLNYSEPVLVRLKIHPPYRQWVLIGSLCLSLVGFVLASAYGVKRRRDFRRAEQALMQEMEEELQTAHDMQMSLMPTKPPQIAGLDIAGRCLPTNHVGGDFFQYFPQDGKISICLTDVTGHAMEAAIPVVMFNGILESQMELGGSLEDLLARLNRSLHRTRVDNRTYVCFCMGELGVSDRHFRLTNAACPYPFHFHAATGEVEEMQVDAYPLGVREGTVYTAIEKVLEPGDRIVFCSDGIAEATDVREEMFGFERTAETIRQACAEDLSAEGLIDHLIGAVEDFAGDAPQGDDMTVVVLKVET